MVRRHEPQCEIGFAARDAHWRDARHDFELKAGMLRKQGPERREQQVRYNRLRRSQSDDTADRFARPFCPGAKTGDRFLYPLGFGHERIGISLSVLIGKGAQIDTTIPSGRLAFAIPERSMLPAGAGPAAWVRD